LNHLCDDDKMIKIGSKVKLVGDESKDGIVIEIKDSFAQINIQNQNEWIPISDLEDKSDELLNRVLKNDLDDGLDFILGIDAYRLLTEYKFNPYVLASSTKIQIFPHQIDEVIWALENPKIMIADEVGLGKTIIAALVATELKARGLANKSLYVVPKSLVLKWRDELNDRFEMDVQIMNSEYVKLNNDPFKLDEFSYITSIDYLKQPHVMNLIKGNLDLVVVDEAHKFKLATDRLELGRLLAEKSNTLMFLTATPHDGRDEDFMARINLLNPYINDISSSNYLWTRNIKEDVIDIEGKKVFPPRQSETVNITLTRREQIIHKLLDDYISQRIEEAQDIREKNAIRFLSHIFRKRGTSSLAALLITLKRRLEKLGTVTDSDEVLQNRNVLIESDEEFDSDYEDSNVNTEIYTTGRNLTKERSDLTKLIEEIEHMGTKDSKLEVLLESIENLKRTDNKAKLVIFTEYRDTLDYLLNSLANRYQVDKIDGSIGIDERKEALNKFSKDTEILICTDAAGEGIDMQFCNIEINYDLPWNPNKLEQRMGRIHRIGQNRNVYYYNFIVDQENSIDGFILSRLLAKIESIRTALGDRIYDILGQILNQDDFVRLYEELLNVPKSQWEAKVVELLEKIEENKQRILEKSDMLLTGHRLDRTTIENISKIRKNAVDKGELKRFLNILIESQKGSFEELNRDQERYKIYPPKEKIISLGISIMEGTFNGTLAREKSWPYLALGNRDINKIIQDTARCRVAALKHQTKSGMLYVYKIVVIDGKGRERNGKVVAMFDGEDGKVREVDPRSVWDYEENSSIKNTNFIVTSIRRVEGQLQYIVDTFYADTSRKLKEIEDKTRLASIGYFANKIEQAQEKIREYEKNLKQGPQFEKLISRKKTEVQKLGKESDEKLISIKKEFQSYPIIELIGIATISPDIEANIRREIELAGMKTVIQYESDRAQTEEDRVRVVDVSERDTGYDVESFDRLIEVKSFKTTGSVSLTSHEWETAQRLKNDYWLYIVENSFNKPIIHQFQNPYELFKNKVSVEQVIDYRYVIKDWKLSFDG